MKARIKEILMTMSGAETVGFARAESVNDICSDKHSQWLTDGNHAEMKYLENHPTLRHDPRLLLEGAKTVISVAFNYYPKQHRSETLPEVSMYAYGEDYHDVLRKRLNIATQQLMNEFGGQVRICIDSAPIHERYWAWKAGIGFQATNGTIIIPNKGSFFFLAEILTTLDIEPDEPLVQSCGNCRLCVDACPGKALLGNNLMNARNCLSYLTIECRHDWSAERFKTTPLFGCDICQKVCPHNTKSVPTEIEEFQPSVEFLNFDFSDFEQMTDDDFKRIFRKSPIKRMKFEGLQRNLKNCKRDSEEKF